MPWNADKSVYTTEKNGSGMGEAGRQYSAAEWNALSAEQKQSKDPGGGWSGGTGNPFDAPGGVGNIFNGNGGWAGMQGLDSLMTGFGYVPQVVDKAAPGGLLDTSQADEERRSMDSLVAQLQQQAASGGGAWEGTLADATDRAKSTAMALGQARQPQDVGSGLMAIGNAKAAAAQRGAGQAEILRNKSKVGAQNQLNGLLGSMGDTDASQAAAKAAAQQGVTELNSALQSNANKQTTKDSTSFGGLAAGAAFSDGGAVPGKAKVFGDDEVNDTVEARLSPGEIVIPRSHAGSPEEAADFVRALKRRPVQHMNAGGSAGDGTGLGNVDPNSAETARGREAGIMSIFLPHIGAGMRQPNQQAPSIENGGLLESSPYNNTRAALLKNAALIQQRANGGGPSTAPQEMQSAMEENVATAMQAGNRTPITDLLNRTTAANQGAAGNAAATTAEEQQAGQGQFGHAMAAQRARDLAFANARQQAAFRQTQMNAGLGLEQQAAMRGLIGGAGQAAMAGASAAGRGDSSYDLNDKNTQLFDEGLSANEFENPYAGNGSSGPADLHDSNDKWSGGEIVDTRGADFVRALKRARR